MSEAPRDPSSDYVEKAERLLGNAGLGALSSIRSIQGGGNNRVFCVTTDAGTRVLLKAYFQSPGDPRNRFLHEQAFHRLAAERGISCVPKVFGWDEEHRLGLFEFVDGRKLDPCEVDTAAVDACSDFFCALNSTRDGEPSSTDLPAASEACFSIEEHLQVVERRVQRLVAAGKAGMREDACALIAGELLPRWETVRASILQRGHSRESLPERMRCFSPSDFGFHNALLSTRGLVFFDFEYSGKDDPAKMACDFFCQPEIPVPENLLPAFLERTLLSNWSKEDYSARVLALLPAYRIKWTCIILNVFVPLDANRRRFANASLLSDESLARQLDKARNQIAATF